MSTFRTSYNTFIPLNRTSSFKTTYRHLLRTAALHQDAFVGSFFKKKWRIRFRSWLERTASREDDIEARLAGARKELRRLQRAVSGHPRLYSWSIDAAYGLCGSARHDVSRPFIDPGVLNPGIPSRSPLPPPIDPSDPSTVVPTYSPCLVSILTSSTKIFRDKSISPMWLAFPPTLPDNAKPGDPELANRLFLAPIREVRLRREHFREITVGKTSRLPITRFPLVVRVVGVPPVSAADGETEDGVVERELRRLGIEWSFYRDGGREKVLHWLELRAGKDVKRGNLAPKKEPIRSLDLTLPIPTAPRRPTPAVSASRSSSSVGRIPASRSKKNPGLPADHRLLYQDLLFNLPILTVDLSRMDSPAWFQPSISPYSKRGAYLFRPTSTDDIGWLRPAEPTAKKEPPGKLSRTEEEQAEFMAKKQEYVDWKLKMTPQERYWHEIGQWIERDKQLDQEEIRLVAEWEAEQERTKLEIQQRKVARALERAKLA
ncbi:hypothetical protein [Phaffia rhodozyma]|uniref:LYR motif-containing protein Cup1-like N-terminal domain-containing protein n=1 Tax=Phaffia rhodozyma TaxID=264483 RepID=A0A0F7SE93_PHARH|nr:hypothetical protein [Phaffia rhodozyma]